MFINTLVINVKSLQKIKIKATQIHQPEFSLG